jgi:hypothetical protein
MEDRLNAADIASEPYIASYFNLNAEKARDEQVMS